MQIHQIYSVNENVFIHSVLGSTRLMWVVVAVKGENLKHFHEWGRSTIPDNMLLNGDESHVSMDTLDGN